MKVRKTLKWLWFRYDICEAFQLEKEIHTHSEEVPHDYGAMNNVRVQAKTSVLFWKKKKQNLKYFSRISPGAQGE